MNRPVKKLYNTHSGQYRPDDVALSFALSLRALDSADHLRSLNPRTPDDAKVFDTALKIIKRVCALLEYLADQQLTIPVAPSRFGCKAET